MRDLVGESLGGGYAGSPGASAGKAAASPHLRGEGASLDSRSPYSSWRYASARESTDSEREIEGWPAAQAAGVALAARAAAAAAAHESPAAPSPVSPPAPSPAAAAHDSAGAGSRQLWSPSKRPAAHAQPGGVYAPGGLQAAPPGVDAASYAAGERAALMMAFQQALPSQQALGQLFSAVDALHSRLEEEAQEWRRLQTGAAKTGAQLEAALRRLDGLEREQLPELRSKWEELSSRAHDHMAGVLGSLQQAVATLAQQREALAAEQAQRGAGAGTLLGSRRLHWLLLAAAGYGQSLLSKADVAALFLSRKILLVPEAGLGGVHEGEKAGSARQLRPLSTALGALLFVAAVEGAHQTQLRAMRRLPAFAQRAVAPAQLGLRVMRAAVWSAAFVLAAAQTRASCQAASDSVCSAAAAAVGSLQLPEWAAMVPLVQRWQQRRLAEQGGQEQPQSPVPQQAQPLRQQQEPGSTLPA